MNNKRIKFSIKEQVIFLKQLGLLLQGGVDLIDGLRTIQNYTRAKAKSIVVNKLITEVEQGRQLSQALSLFPAAFNIAVIQNVKVAETSGTLTDSLLAAAVELQNSHAVRKKVIGGLIYPAIVVTATIIVTGLLLLYVFPKVLPVFAGLQITLPLTTRLLVTTYTALREHIVLVFIVNLGLTLLALFSLRYKRLKKLRDQILLTLPLVGNLMQSYILANFCRTLGQLLKQHVPVVKAVAITATVTRHKVYKHKIIALSLALNHGQSLTQFFQQEPKLFPPLLQQLISVGEKTGTLGDNLLFLSDIYRQDITDLLSNITSLLEPTMMIALGGLVGFVAISIITPIYEVTQNLHG